MGSTPILQRAMRLELTTPTLATWCSTTELRPQRNTQSIYASPGPCNPFFFKNSEVMPARRAVRTHSRAATLAERTGPVRSDAVRHYLPCIRYSGDLERQDADATIRGITRPDSVRGDSRPHDLVKVTGAGPVHSFLAPGTG